MYSSNSLARSDADADIGIDAERENFNHSIIRA